MTLSIGDVIEGKYRIIGQIGKDGMSTVWLATDSRINKRWAIREIRKNAPVDAHAATINRFRVEAKFMMKELDHPALPRVADVFEDGDSLFVVMDYVDGENPLQTMRRNQCPIAEGDVIDWGMQLCDALSQLHACGIIHRNVQPGNMVLQEDGRVKLFGFCLLSEPKDQLEYDAMPLGVRGYTPPEGYWRGGRAAPRFDVYSLGVTLFHLSTGKGPREFADLPVLPPARSVNPALSKRLERIITKATQWNPAERYQSCSEMRCDLVRLNDGNMLHASPSRSLFAKVARAIRDR